eukprot:15439031-Alexandrium_andersonii.AAC.1
MAGSCCCRLFVVSVLSWLLPTAGLAALAVVVVAGGRVGDVLAAAAAAAAAATAVIVAGARKEGLTLPRSGRKPYRMEECGCPCRCRCWC